MILVVLTRHCQQAGGGTEVFRRPFDREQGSTKPADRQVPHVYFASRLPRKNRTQPTTETGTNTTRSN